jgi:hypothetical protein
MLSINSIPGAVLLSISSGWFLILIHAPQLFGFLTQTPATPISAMTVVIC